MNIDLPMRPSMPPEEQARAKQQALRARMLTGLWLPDLEKALQKHISPDRRSVWGIPEASRNPFRSLSTQIGGALYRSPPIIRGDDGLASAVQAAGYWQLQQRQSTNLVGLRETLLRVDWSERGGLLHRAIAPDLAIVRSLPEAPDVPTAIEELQVRPHPKTGAKTWCWEMLDISDLEQPLHQFLSGDRKEDWTSAMLPGADGYQYRDRTGRPYLPVVQYHAERTGRLWDSFYGIEAVLGSLTIGVLMTFWVHGVKDGSFATVLLVNGQVVGLEIVGPDGQARTQILSTEPGSIIEVSPISEGVQPSAIQLHPGFEPDKLMDAIGSFGAGLAEYAGVSQADLVRTGADPRSGASLSISREGLRSAQSRLEPQLRRGDLDVLAVSARVLNRATGTSYAEQPTLYSISYPALPLSAEEVRTQREDILAKIGAGLLSKVDAMMRLHPGISREQAMLELQRVQRENALFPSI